MSKRACVQCGGEEWIEQLAVVDRGESNRRYALKLEMDVNPEAAFFKERVDAPLLADVCAGCGAVVMRVTPKALEQLKSTKLVRDTQERMGSRSGDFRDHPRYGEFVGQDAAYRYMSAGDVAVAFAEWLRKVEG